MYSSLAHARTTAIDDSGTQAVEPSVSMHWKSVVPQRSSDNQMMVGATTIRVRLNVAPWLRHSGRIYLVLPTQQPGPISASWSTQGRLLPGQIHSGTRSMIYAGPVIRPVMEDVFVLQFSIDGKLMRRPFPVTFRFEMDED